MAVYGSLGDCLKMSPVLAGVDKGSDTMREGYWGGVNSGNGGNNGWRVVSDSSMMRH